MLPLLILLGPLLLPASETPASDPTVKVDVSTPTVRLTDLHAKPAAWLGRRVRVVVQLDALVDDWNPWMSRFTPRCYTQIAGWPDEHFTWNERVFQNPVRGLFLRRGAAFEAALREAKRFARLEVHGTVKEMQLGVPAIQVDALRVLDTHVGEGTLLHVDRAFSLLEQGRIELALDQLERAKAAPLPAHARAELERRIIDCHRLREAEADRKQKGPRIRLPQRPDVPRRQ